MTCLLNIVLNTDSSRCILDQGLDSILQVTLTLLHTHVGKVWGNQYVNITLFYFILLKIAEMGKG